MSARLTAGKLLSAEQSVTLAMLESVDRDALIAAIVAGMRQAAKLKKGGRPARQFNGQQPKRS